METIKSNKNRANAVRIIFYIMMALNIISGYSNILQYTLLNNAKNGIAITNQMAQSNDNRQRVIAFLMLVLIAATIISFIMWVHRAYKNLYVLKIEPLDYTPGWAAGAWFVPFLNLVRPYQIVSEIWLKTQRVIKEENDINFKIIPKSIVGWWWGFWLTNNIVSNISSRIILSASSVDDFLTATIWAIISDGLGMVAMVLTLVLVNNINLFEDNLWKHCEEKNKAEINNPLIT